MQYGRPLGIVGAILALVGTVLPWMSFSDAAGTVYASGLATIIFGIPVLLFAIIGLVLVFLPKKGLAIGACVMGILAMIFVVLAMTLTSLLSGIAAGYGGGVVSVGIEYGAYVSIVGSILLMIGGGYAYWEYSKAEVPMPVPQMPPTGY